MAIFSGFLKSTPELPGARTVPNGGLGGLVQVQASDEVSNNMKRKGYEDNIDKKRPPPIRLGTSDVLLPPASAPLRGYNNDFPRSLRTPRTAVRASSGGPMTMRSVHSEVQNSPRMVSHEHSQFLHPLDNIRSVTSPKRFGNHAPEPVYADIPPTPPIPDRGTRSTTHVYPYGDEGARPHAKLLYRTTPDQLTQPKASYPDEMDNLKSAIRSTFKPPYISQDGLPSVPNITTNSNAHYPLSPNPLSKDISTLSAHELLAVLPKLKSKVVINAWIPAMEKEFGKIKALADKFDGDKAQESRLIKIFSEDMKNLLLQSKEIAARYDEEFTLAQAAVDANKQTDLEKLELAERRLHDTVTIYNRKLQENAVELIDSQRVQSSLIHVNTIFGGFIRNNLANTLHNSENGLNQEVIRLLAAFDRTEPATYTQNSVGNIPAARYDSICRNLFEAQEKIVEMQTLLDEQQALTVSNSKQLEKLTEQLQRRTDEKRKADREIASLRAQLDNEKAQNDIYREMTRNSPPLKDGKPDVPPKNNNYQVREPSAMGGFIGRTASAEQPSKNQHDPVNAYQNPVDLSFGMADHIGSRNTVLYRPRNVFSIVPVSPVSPHSATYDHTSGSDDEARSASISSISSSRGWPYTSAHDPMLSPISRPRSPMEKPPTDLTHHQYTNGRYHHDECPPLKVSKRDDSNPVRGRAESVTAADEWEYDWEGSKHEH